MYVHNHIIITIELSLYITFLYYYYYYYYIIIFLPRDKKVKNRISKRDGSGTAGTPFQTKFYA